MHQRCKSRNLVCGLSRELYEESIHGSQLSKEGATSANVFGALLGLLRGPDRPFPEHSLCLLVQHSRTHKEEGLRISLRVQRPSLSFLDSHGTVSKRALFWRGERWSSFLAVRCHLGERTILVIISTLLHPEKEIKSGYVGGGTT